MKHKYLEEFQKDVKAAHDPKGKTCHWTREDELTDPTKVSDQEGPCNCPSRKKNAACDQHSQIQCENTAAVLAQKPESLKKYEQPLKDLADAMEDIDDLIAKYQKALDDLVTQNQGDLDEAIKDKGWSKGLAGNWAPIRPATRSILKIKVKQDPIDKRLPPSCQCKCFDNKVDRLNKEKNLIKSLRTELTLEEGEIKALVEAQTPTFSSTVKSVLKPAVSTVTNLLGGNFSAAGTSALDLLNYLDSLKYEGLRIFTLLKIVQQYGNAKRGIMLGVIYHDQQWLSKTCMPVITDEEDGPGSGKAVPGGEF